MIQDFSKKLQAGLLSFSAVILFLLFLLSGYQFLNWQKIYPGVAVAGIDLAAKTEIQAANLLRQRAQNQKDKLILKYQGQIWQIPLTELQFAYSSQSTARQAYLVGRTGDFKKDLAQKFAALTGKTNLSFNYQLNSSQLQTEIASLSAQINTPSIPPRIQLIKKGAQSEIQIQPGQSGEKLQEAVLKKEISHRLGYLLNPEISLPVENLLPAISQIQLEATKNRAEKFLAKKINISFEENSWQLNEAELIAFLDFHNGFDQEKVASFTAQLAQSIDRPPQNALFKFLPAQTAGSQARVKEFQPSKKGQALKRQETISLLNQTLKAMEQGEGATTTLILPVELTEPAVSTQDVNSLGIQELIGCGQSWFQGSISSRIHNIQLASQQINGLLVAPEETFSLNQALGDVSVQTGYQKAWIIKQGRTVLGDGGGVCQVSTTLFRAALKAGLPIIERQAHDYRVAYYEQNYQVGVDATVFAPSPDLKFKNDTSAHILIQTIVDLNQMKATYNLYGTADGRQVTISSSRIWDQVPPPPDLYQDDPTLPSGVIKQIDWKAWGVKTAFDWRVIRHGKVLQQRTFYSHYRPWQAVFLKGTGG